VARNARTEAEARYAKAQKRMQDASEAMTEARADAKRVDDNTARLKALRLAREAKEAAERAAAPPAKPSSRAKKKPAAPPMRKAGSRAKRKTVPESIPVEKLNASNDE